MPDFLLSTLSTGLSLTKMFDHRSEHASKIKVPRDMQAVKDLAEVLSSYKQLYLFHVSLIYSLVFILYVT